MEVVLMKLIDYFANISFQYIDVFTNQLKPNEKDGDRTTAFHISGLVIPVSGSGKFTLNGHTYRIDQNTILHAGPGMQIEIETIGDQPWEYAVVHYKFKEGPSDFEKLAHTDFPIYVGDNPKIQLLIQQLVKQQSIPGSLANLQSKVLFGNLIETIILSAKKVQCNRKSELIATSIDFIHAHYTEELVIAEIAEQYGMERRRFSHTFEQYTGLTPVQYITEYRLRKAKELLKSSTCSIARIAETIGYQDSFYFSRLFKKHVQMSPSQYRKEWLKRTITT